MAKSCVVIVNPVAGRGRAGRAWPELAQLLAEHGLEHTTSFTQAPGDAIELCRAALRTGAQTVVAAGGDGTLNEIVNGFVDKTTDAPLNPHARVGFIPLGTGSDFARSLGIGRDRAAIRQLCESSVRHVDIGRIDMSLPGGPSTTRYFANVAFAGLGVETNEYARRSPKLLGGFAAYLVGVVRSILSHRSRHVSLSLDHGLPVSGPMSIVAAANNRYFGAGMLVAPDAQPDDGFLDILWLGHATRRRLLIDLLPKLYRGAHQGHPAVRYARAKRITITSSEQLRLNLDGEATGEAPATITVVPRALPIIAPPVGQSSGPVTRSAQGGGRR